jgi:hypothetical protein
MKDLIRKSLSDLIGKTIDISNIQQRGIGDKIERLVIDTLFDKIGGDIKVYEAKSKRSIEDVQIVDGERVYKVDVKSHDVNGNFSMPNMISISRLKRFYIDPNNFFVIVMVSYHNDDKVSVIEDIVVNYIEDLSWDIIKIQNLGKGQIQIENMKNELKFFDGSRREWLEKLRDNAIEYYRKLITKIEKEWLNEWL